MSSTPRRRRLVPEVIQTSPLDCGPAALRAALLGHGIDVNYEQLREACRTNIDGTAMNDLATLADQLGLVAEQIWMPRDHLTLADAPFPAICVIRLPNGLLHYILVWSRVGPLYQVMDPVAGRRWLTGPQLLGILHDQELEVASEAWREWAAGGELERALRERLRRLGASELLLEEALVDPSCVSLCALDGAVRLVETLAVTSGLTRGPETAAMAEGLYARARSEWAAGHPPTSVPASFYSALPLAEGQMQLRGPVVIRIRGQKDEGAAVLSPEEAAQREAFSGPTPKPWAQAWQLLLEDGRRSVYLLLGAIAVTSCLGGIEALLLRTLVDLGLKLGLSTQRITAGGLLVGFLLLGLALELWSNRAVRGMGRRLELRLRTRLLEKIPRLEDAYFQTRTAADLAYRSHVFHAVRETAPLFARIFQLYCDLLVATTVLVWLCPSLSWLALLAATLCVATPFLGRSLLSESELQVAAFGGSLAQSCLDALIGAVSIRAHGAERAVRWEQGGIVLEWARAARERLRLLIGTELIQSAVTVGLAVTMVGLYLRGGAEVGGSLLYVYFALTLPNLGQELAVQSRALPRHRNLLLRLLEPMASTQVVAEATTLPQITPGAPPAHLELRSVRVEALGKVVLSDVNLELAPGEHVAVVGPSGAGKSSLLSVLLGWLPASGGEVHLDGAPLDYQGLVTLRAQTAWIDPAITLWNRSLLDNVRYGATNANVPVDRILDQADLIEVLERLPDGLQTPLGESGRLLSGGEGQRVRIARAMVKAEARLVLLDEPFRGVDREERRLLLNRSRQLWAKSTLVCVTHDLSHTLGFDRVVVVDGGKIVEQGPPRELAARPGSRFAALLRAEEQVHRNLWQDPTWRRIRLAEGSVHEDRRKAVG